MVYFGGTSLWEILGRCLGAGLDMRSDVREYLFLNFYSGVFIHECLFTNFCSCFFIHEFLLANFCSCLAAWALLSCARATLYILRG